MISVPRRNDFTLSFPFIERTYINGVTYDNPMDLNSLENMQVTITSAVGTMRTFDPYIERNVVFVNFPDTLEVGKYDVAISATRKQDGKDICSLLQKCFAIVEWNNKSDYLDYIIGSPLLTATSVFVANKNLFVQTKEVTYTTNGEREVFADEGYALSSIKIKVDVQPTEELVITENGRYDVTNAKSISVRVECSGGDVDVDDIPQVGEDEINDLFDDETTIGE